MVFPWSFQVLFRPADTAEIGYLAGMQAEFTTLDFESHDPADMPVSLVAERFLRAVIEQVPLEQIEELHLFSPLRQGTLETGIAVLATRPDPAPVTRPDPVLATSPDPVLVASPDTVLAVSPDAVHTTSPDPVDETSREDDVDQAVETPLSRHTVFTARYRHTIKGPERGKWETSVKAEADAPLVTVETVVRGVQRRAGGDSAIVRYSASQIARALRVEPGLPVA